ncbi:MAG: histidine kinase [Bacteroidota bacterium]
MKRINIILEVVVHVVLWGSIYALSSFPEWYWGPFSSADGSLALANLYGFGFNILLFYANAFYLVPKFFRGKNTQKYWGLAVVTVIVISLLESGMDGIYGDALGKYDERSFTFWFVAMLPQTTVVNTFYFLLSWAYAGPRDWLKDRRIKEQLQREKLVTELNYLKAQINPHFLFNGINSVYHLIDGNPDLAKNTLLKFSNLLRYQLYECNDEVIPLRQEVEYLENFITLEQLRKGDDATISWHIYTDDDQQKIAPLLMTPFIENAFKYLSHHLASEKNILDIQLNVEVGVLDLKVKNTFEELGSPDKKFGGLGLQNVQRRLTLLYPQHHKLVIKNDENFFTVHLQIQLTQVPSVKSNNFKMLEKI